MECRQIKIIVLWTALILPVFNSTVAQPVDEDIAAIHQAYSDWTDATNAKDIQTWSVFLGHDPFFAPPDHPALETREEVLQFYMDLFADPDFVILDCKQLDITVAKSRDMAWSRGKCVATFHNGDNADLKIPSKWNKVWIKDASGKWKCRLNTWNGNG
jgi:ketosteroid isomerase-like protein